MAKDGNRLGTKPATLQEAVTATPPAGLRSHAIAVRADALAKTISDLEPLTDRERTATIAAVAEFYGLTLTVEN